MRGYCGFCSLDYDFISYQETANDDQEFILKLLGAESLHVPKKYSDSLDASEIAKPYKNFSRALVENLYKNYFPYVYPV